MKLIIDIPKANYEKMKTMDVKSALENPYLMAIAQGTPLTNKALEQESKSIQEKQAESERYQKAFDDGYANGYSQARFDYEPKTDTLDKVLSEQIKGRCFECIHFELDAMIDCDGVPLIGAHKICNKWGRGCKTDTNGYCFMFEGKKTQ